MDIFLLSSYIRPISFHNKPMSCHEFFFFFYQNHSKTRLIIIVIKHLHVVVNFTIILTINNKSFDTRPMHSHIRLMSYHDFHFYQNYSQIRFYHYYGKAYHSLLQKRALSWDLKLNFKQNWLIMNSKLVRWKTDL